MLGIWHDYVFSVVEHIFEIKKKMCKFPIVTIILGILLFTILTIPGAHEISFRLPFFYVFIDINETW